MPSEHSDGILNSNIIKSIFCQTDNKDGSVRKKAANLTNRHNS